MGVTYSMADSSSASSAPPAMPNFSAPLSPGVAALMRDAAPPPAPRVNYLALPAPVRYEAIQQEVLMALKPDLFEGLRLDMTRPLNQNFFLSHNLFMGNTELPAGPRQIIKTPIGSYEFGATVADEGYMLMGRISADGRLMGRGRYDVADWLGIKGFCQLSNEEGGSQMMVDADLKGADWNAQLKLGNPNFVGLNYLQSVTPGLSAGGEFFWLSSNQKSGVGLTLRQTGEKHLCTLQVATTGILSLQYLHKVTDKVALATDLMWHWAHRDATATVGYDVMLRSCRIRGKIDTKGVISAFLEERLSPGINLVFSAEVDHNLSNYKFGFGVTAGE